MSLLDAYRQKLEIQIQEHKQHLELLKARARHAAAQSKAELALADKHLDKAKARFKELKGAGSHAFDDIKAGVKNALADLKVSTTKAARHFNPPPPLRKSAPVKPRHRSKPAHPATPVKSAPSAKTTKR